MLFKDAEDLETAFPSLGAIAFNRLAPQIELAELEMFRTEVLGPTLYDQLHAAYQASIASSPTALPAKWAALLPYVRKAVAHFAFFDTTDLVTLVLGTGGAYVSTTEGQERAPMWAVEAFKTKALQKAHSFLNLLLSFLMEKEATDYPDWANSAYRRQVRGSLIPRIADANEHIRMGGWLLHKLQPTIKRIQRGPILKILGSDAAYDALLLATHNNTLNASQRAMMDHIVPALLHGALGNMIVELGVSIDRSGVWTWESTSSGSQIAGGVKSAAADRRIALQQDQQKKSLEALTELDKLVNPNRPTGRPGRDHGNLYHF